MNTASSDPTSDGFVHEFKFVSDKSAESRKLIRTHVMREHKRREKWQGARKGNRPGAHPDHSRQLTLTSIDGQQKGVDDSRRPARKTKDNVIESLGIGKTDLRPHYSTWQLPFTVEPVRNFTTQKKAQQRFMTPSSDDGTCPTRFSMSVSSSLATSLDEDKEAREIDIIETCPANSVALTWPWSKKIAGANRALHSPRFIDPMHMTRAVGAGMLDPFMAHAESNFPNVQSLIYDYVSFFTTVSSALEQDPAINPITSYWFPWILTDPVLFHATLLKRSRFLDKARGQAESPNSRYLMAESIRLLRERVQDKNIEVADETIAAVVNLAAIENDRGDFSKRQTHLNGLQHMIALRGGVNAVKSSSPTCDRMIRWLNIITKNKVQRAPLRGLVLHDTHAPSMLEYHGDYKHLSLSAEISYLMQEIRYLSRKLATTTDSSDSQRDAIRSLLQCELSLPPTLDCRPRVMMLSESCRAAACLYLLLLSNGQLSGQEPLEEMLVDLLKTSLESIGGSTYEEGPFFLWLLSMGGVAAFGGPARGWFVTQFMYLATDLSIRTWEDLKVDLEKFLWCPEDCEIPFRDFWADVELMKNVIEEETWLSSVP